MQRDFLRFAACFVCEVDGLRPFAFDQVTCEASCYVPRSDKNTISGLNTGNLQGARSNEYEGCGDANKHFAHVAAYDCVQSPPPGGTLTITILSIMNPQPSSFLVYSTPPPLTEPVSVW